MNLKLSQKDSYAAESEEINAIIQEYVKVKRHMFFRFKRAEEALGNGNTVPMASFIERYTSFLQKCLQGKAGEPDDSDAIVFAFLILGTQYMLNTLLGHDAFRYTNIQVHGIDNAVMYNYKRTGLFRTIINDEVKLERDLPTQLYIFRHRRYNNNTAENRSKEQRIYLARTFLFQNSKHILLIIVEPTILETAYVNNQLALLEIELSEILKQNDVDFGYNLS